MMKKLLLVPLAVIFMFGVIFDVYGAVDKYGGILKWPIQVGPTVIGYPPEGDPQSRVSGQPALECFMRFWPKGVIESRLSTGYEISPNGTSITLTLRQGVKFHDGTQFNVPAAKWNIEKYIEAKALRGFDSVDMINDYTVRVNVKQYTNMLLDDIGTVQIISPTAAEKNGLDWARQNPVGTGPFILKKHERDSKVIYERNPNYWEKGKPYLDGIELIVIKDETVRKIAFENGDITFMRAIGMTAKELKDKGYDFVSMSGGTYTLFPDSNNLKSPMADKKVRLAMSHALNREAIAQALGYGFASPAYRIFPGWETVPGLKKHEYNPEKARQLLADAGYPNGFKTTMHCMGRIIPKEYHEAVAGMLRKIGIDVTTEYPEMGTYQELRFKGWKGLMSHPMAVNLNLNKYLQMYYDRNQFPNCKKPEGFREAMDASYFTKSYDPVKVQAVIQLLHDDVTVIPYVEELAIDFIHKGVHDMHLMEFALEGWVYEDAWLDPNLR